MFFKSCFLVTLLVVSSYCKDIAQDVQKQLESQFGKDVLHTGEEKVLEYLHQKCLANADEDAFLKVKDSRKEAFDCVKGLVNVEVIKKEIEDAKPTGSLDVVFKKYCDKTPQFKTCIYSYVDKLERCMTKSEVDTAQQMRTALNSLAEFVCFNDGDRIALFIAEDGPGCLNSKMSAVQQCANSTFPMPTPTADFKNLPEFTFNKENCEKITAFKQCSVRELETCTEPTTANMVESLINYVLKSTKCKDFKA